MTAITLPNAGLTAGYLEGESGWHAAMNRNIRILDAIAQGRALDKDLGEPPASPSSGSLYIVGLPASGAWTGQGNKLALYQVGDDLATAWLFITPRTGWRLYVVDEGIYYKYNGSAWIDDTATGGGGSGEANTTSNLGGVGLAAAKSGVNLPFKGLAAGQGAAISADSTTVTIRTVYISSSDPGAVGAGVIWVTP